MARTPCLHANGPKGRSRGRRDGVGRDSRTHARPLACSRLMVHCRACRSHAPTLWSGRAAGRAARGGAHRSRRLGTTSSHRKPGTVHLRDCVINTKHFGDDVDTGRVYSLTDLVICWLVGLLVVIGWYLTGRTPVLVTVCISAANNLTCCILRTPGKAGGLQYLAACDLRTLIEKLVLCICHCRCCL